MSMTNNLYVDIAYILLKNTSHETMQLAEIAGAEQNGEKKLSGNR